MEKKRLKAKAADLLTKSIQHLQLTQHTKVLDLACGNGRNGLYLANFGAQVSFIDQDLSRLETVPAHCHQLRFDLENGQQLPFSTEQFDLILVFNYLHRPLFPQIKALAKPGGLIVYETFIKEQANYGRPKNPDFLLTPNELSKEFEQFKSLYYFEGNIGCENKPCFKAQLIAQKVNSP